MKTVENAIKEIAEDFYGELVNLKYTPHGNHGEPPLIRYPTVIDIMSRIDTFNVQDEIPSYPYPSIIYLSENDRLFCLYKILKRLYHKGAALCEGRIKRGPNWEDQ